MVRYSFLVRLSHPLLHAGLIPALSLITLVARIITTGGIVRPICLAAFRLMMNSNFVGQGHCPWIRAMTMTLTIFSHLRRLCSAKGAPLI